MARKRGDGQGAFQFKGWAAGAKARGGRESHARVLRTPREVRAALCYVLQNARRHATDERRMIDPGWDDPRSSGVWLEGWAGDVQLPPAASIAPVSEPRTWLLTTGWRRAGLIRVDEVPAAALTPPRPSRAG
jgi:hypothetical protein